MCLFGDVICACSKAETESDPNQGIHVVMFLITKHVPSRNYPADAGLQLEESPKWHLLTMVLEEIHQESRKNTASEYINLTVTQMTIYRTFQLTVCNSYYICVFTITSIDSGRWRKSSGSSE